MPSSSCDEDDVDVIQARIAERLAGLAGRPCREMIRKLEAEGLVAIDEHGIALTDEGRSWPSASCAATASPSASSPTSSGCRGPRPTTRPASGST